jgi:hypothetical protein
MWMPSLKRPAATSFGVSLRIQTAISNGYVFPSAIFFIDMSVTQSGSREYEGPVVFMV